MEMGRSISDVTSRRPPGKPWKVRHLRIESRASFILGYMN